MNTPSPLIPQGTRPPRGKSSIYFKVLMILAVHVVLIGGMLLQGCKDTSKDQSKDTSITQSQPDTTSPNANTAAPTAEAPGPAVSPANLSNTVMNPSPAPSNLPPQPAPAMAATPVPAALTPPPAPAAGGGKEYVVARGDILVNIAHKNGVSLKALTDANPGVNPKKLKIGQKLQIPAGSTGVASSAGAGMGVEGASGDVANYTVKSGDTLGKIARAHGTTFKKIMAMNDLKTTGIRVGQKLKLPAPKPAGTEAMPVSASAAPVQPAPAPGPVSAAPAPAPTGVAN